MHLRELKRKPPAELVSMAEELGVEGASTMRRQDLMFCILRELAEDEEYAEPIMGIGTIEVLQDGFGFLRSPEANYLAGPDDIYVSPNQVRRWGLRTGDTVEGEIRHPKDGERYFALTGLKSVNFDDPEAVRHRTNFDNLTPLYPEQKLTLDTFDPTVKDKSARVIDIISPQGKGQRALIVAPPRTGKTVLLLSSDLDEILQLADRVIVFAGGRMFGPAVRGAVGGRKKDQQLCTAGSPQRARAHVARGDRVFLDLKYHDIPNTVAQACAAAARLGVWMINVHALGGTRMMSAAREAIEGLPQRPKLIGVTVLTSMAAPDLEEIGGGPRDEDVPRALGVADGAVGGGQRHVVHQNRDRDPAQRPRLAQDFPRGFRDFVIHPFARLVRAPAQPTTEGARAEQHVHPSPAIDHVESERRLDFNFDASLLVNLARGGMDERLACIEPPAGQRPQVEIRAA